MLQISSYSLSTALRTQQHCSTLPHSVTECCWQPQRCVGWRQAPPSSHVHFARCSAALQRAPTVMASQCTVLVAVLQRAPITATQCLLARIPNCMLHLVRLHFRNGVRKKVTQHHVAVTASDPARIPGW